MSDKKNRMMNSVTGTINVVVYCLLVAGDLNDIFRHVSDACQTVDTDKNDSEYS